MKQITTAISVNYATGIGTIENDILTAIIPSFTGSFNGMDINFRYLQGERILKAGSRSFNNREQINQLFEAVKSNMVKSFDNDFSGALEEAFYLVFKMEMFATLSTLNPNLTMDDLIISSDQLEKKIKI